MLPWTITSFHSAQSASQKAQTYQQLNAACKAYELAFRMRDAERCAWIVREFRRAGLFVTENAGHLIWEHIGEPVEAPRKLIRA